MVSLRGPSVGQGTESNCVEDWLLQIVAHRLRQQGRDLLRLVGPGRQSELTQEGRRLLYRLALLLLAWGAQMEALSAPQGGLVLEGRFP
jgi:hypothetical protein